MTLDLSGAAVFRIVRKRPEPGAGALAFALMVLAFQPILRFYRLSPLWGLALPAIAAAYMVFTLDSAYQHRARTRRTCGRAGSRRTCPEPDDDDHRYQRRPRRIAERIFRSRRRSFIRAIAKPFSHFIGLRAPPTTSRITPRCPKTRSSRGCSAWRTRCSASSDAAADALPLRARAGQARSFATPRAGSADGLSHGRHQAPLSGLGRSDPLLHLFGDACRPLRARCAWREPRDLAGQRRALRGACRSSTICRIAAPIIKNIDRVYIPLDALDRHGLTVEALAADKASPQLLQCIQDLAERTSALAAAMPQPFSAQIDDLRLSLEVSVIQRLATKLDGDADDARSLERTRAFE